MQAAAASTSASGGRLTSPSPATEPSNSALAPTTTATDLSQFLTPSFDASAYVSSLIAAVDTSLDSQSRNQNVASTIGASTSGQHLLPPTTTPPRKPSISLSPTQPTASTRTQAQEEVDLSLAISRLNLAIEELDKSISSQVTSHAPELLSRTSALGTMQSGVAATRDGIVALDEEVARLRGRLHDPYVRATELQGRIKVYDAAGELVERTGKVVGLARRLEVQMEGLFAKKDTVGVGVGAEGEKEGEDAVVGQVHGRDLSRAALLISELTTLLNSTTSPGESSLLDLKLVQDLLPAIESAKKTVVDYMEDMIVRGLRDLSPLMLGSSLQTAFNLNTLPTLVQDLLNDLTEVVKERTAAAFNLDTLSRQLNSPIPTFDHPSSTNYSAYRRKGTADAATTEKQRQMWAEAIWKRLESFLVVEMGAVCSKVYLLEKVLKLKTSDGGVNFLAAALEVLGDKPSTTFWLTLSQSLQQQVASAVGKSVWLGQLLSTGTGADGGNEGYVRLLRVVQEFFGKIGVYTDVQYSATHQSAEMVVLVKSLGALEKVYFDKATARIGEVLFQATARRGGLGEEEAESVVRLVANLLDTTRFDPLLSRAAVERCTALVDQFASRMDAVVAKDFSMGNDDGTQGYHASLARFSHFLATGLRNIAEEQDPSSHLTASTTAAVTGSPTVTSTKLLASSDHLTSKIRTTINTPLLTQARTTISTALAKMHAQLSSTTHSNPQQAGQQQGRRSIDSSSGASSYATEVCDLLWNLRDRILPLYPPSIAVRIAQTIAKATVEGFLLNAAVLALPQGEGEADRVKLRLATDMTELEFAVTQIVGDLPSSAASKARDGWVEEEASLLASGEAKRLSGVMKAFRRVLFQSLEELEKDGEKVAVELPRVILVLHLSSRAGSVDRVISKVVPVKGAKSAVAKAEFVQWVSQQASIDGGKEGNLLSRISESVPEDIESNASQLIQRLLKS